MNLKTKPSLFEYSDYRVFLKDQCTWLKENHRSFSFRNFSRLAGFKAPNFLQLIIKGERNISAESIEKIAKVFQLTKEETSFFRNLVSLNQAKTTDEKSHCAEQMVRSRLYRKFSPLKKEQFEYYAQWYFVAIREMMALPHFKEDPEWIAKNLKPSITTSEATKAIELLLKLGLVKRNKIGKLIPQDTTLSTGDEVSSTSIAQFHKNMMQKGMESIDQVAREKRDISSITIPVSHSNVQKIKQLIRNFRKQLLVLSTDEKTPDEVYQANFQFFPLTQIKKERKL